MSNADRREAAHAPRNQAATGRIQRSIERLVTGGGKTIVEVKSGRRSSLDKYLGVLEIESTAEGKSGASEGEAPARSNLCRARRRAKGSSGRRRERLGPDQRQPQLTSARSGGCAKRSAIRFGVQGPRHGHPFHLSKQPLDSLGGEVGEGTRKVKKERRTRSRTGSRAVCQLVGQDDHLSHVEAETTARSKTCANFLDSSWGDLCGWRRALRLAAPCGGGPCVSRRPLQRSSPCVDAEPGPTTRGPARAASRLATPPRARPTGPFVRLVPYGSFCAPTWGPICWNSVFRDGYEGPSMQHVPPPKRHPYDQWTPDARALDLVGDKWTLLIIRDLAAGPRRFVELQRVLPGISTEQLRSRLNRMVADGMLTRRRFREVPPRVEYELTERARDLMPTIGELARWGYTWTWSAPRDGERVDIDAILRLAPGLAKLPRDVHGR